MFEKIKRYIHKIKRHRRNKQLSKFADTMFEASSGVCYKIGIHPLIYEIINFRHHDSFALKNLFPDYQLSGYYRFCFTLNEWHYVKDELPELYKDVLVVFSQGDCDVKHLTNHNEWVGRGSWCSLTDVIA